MELFASAQRAEEEPDPERARVATCVLLLEVAGADDEFSPQECERIVEILRSRFELSQEDAEGLIRVAQDRRAESFDLWKFTNMVNEACRTDEKRQIIEEIWRVIYADQQLDPHEDYLVHKLAKLLNLTHPQLIKAKVKVLDEMRGKATEN